PEDVDAREERKRQGQHGDGAASHQQDGAAPGLGCLLTHFNRRKSNLGPDDLLDVADDVREDRRNGSLAFDHGRAQSRDSIRPAQKPTTAAPRSAWVGCALTYASRSAHASCIVLSRTRSEEHT